MTSDEEDDDGCTNENIPRLGMNNSSINEGAYRMRNEYQYSKPSGAGRLDHFNSQEMFAYMSQVDQFPH